MCHTPNHTLCTHTCTLLLIALRIVSQPKDVLSEPGEKLEFTFETSPKANSYKWYFNESEISDEDQDYEGSTTEQLVLSKCLPKHKGFFKCVVTNDSGRSLASETATLMIGKLELLLNTSILVLKFVATSFTWSALINSWILISGLL